MPCLRHRLFSFQGQADGGPRTRSSRPSSRPCRYLAPACANPSPDAMPARPHRPGRPRPLRGGATPAPRRRGGARGRFATTARGGTGHRHRVRGPSPLHGGGRPAGRRLELERRNGALRAALRQQEDVPLYSARRLGQRLPRDALRSARRPRTTVLLAAAALFSTAVGVFLARTCSSWRGPQQAAAGGDPRRPPRGPGAGGRTDLPRALERLASMRLRSGSWRWSATSSTPRGSRP